MTASRARAAGLVLGFVADRILGDPQRLHPVAGFGRAAAALERRTYADRRAAGVLHVAVLVGGSAGSRAC
ncbi:cobalamin biosynthesis protein CobD/CbiB [Aeromicrobium sp. SORGH_AS981]|uniref:cobalamin biosynthesis protein n=1 Tax=Aeromicrobium sp. SORGH_AS_0981 TaxID=3041802 RepID=UPI002855ADF2|nr:cobalamin biosynthesis protein [Aeromicrobium sp. SORGH_AS_0981]MDR6117359.1 cobalamin biosynthesis protein CobD/CbiB [Aeromicrobium sp. SORGH_AS_0981]